MPRIVKWEEKAMYVRPTLSIDLSFLTKAAEIKIEKAKNLADVIEDLSSELWFCEHMTNYASPFIDLKEETWET